MNRIHIHNINENQRRAMRVALSGLDEILCEAERWTEGRETEVFFM